ncbi:hypothetical protein Tco_1134889 [Tanacetum coccineum]
MSEPTNIVPTPTTSAVRNTVGKGNDQNLDRPTSDAALQEYCDKYYHQLLSIIAEKVHQEKGTTRKVERGQGHLGIGRKIEVEEMKEYLIDWEAKEGTCPYVRKAAIKIPTQKERIPFPESITKSIRESHQSSLRAKIGDEDTGNQD